MKEKRREKKEMFSSFIHIVFVVFFLSSPVYSQLSVGPSATASEGDYNTPQYAHRFLVLITFPSSSTGDVLMLDVFNDAGNCPTATPPFAVLNSDYLWSGTQNINLPAGTKRYLLTVEIVGDVVFEANNEALCVKATLGASSVTTNYYILDDDPVVDQTKDNSYTVDIQSSLFFDLLSGPANPGSNDPGYSPTTDYTIDCSSTSGTFFYNNVAVTNGSFTVSSSTAPLGFTDYYPPKQCDIDYDSFIYSNNAGVANVNIGINPCNGYTPDGVIYFPRMFVYNRYNFVWANNDVYTGNEFDSYTLVIIDNNGFEVMTSEPLTSSDEQTTIRMQDISYSGFYHAILKSSLSTSSNLIYRGDVDPNYFYIQINSINIDALCDFC